MPAGKHTGKGKPQARPPELRAQQRRERYHHPAPPAPPLPDPAEPVEGTGEGQEPIALTREGLKRLPEDDPFLLIDSIDATGGITGSAKKRMTATAASAFRRYCTMAPSTRTLPNLHKVLEREWGQSPSSDTLYVWSADYAWDRLLREYDLARDRIRWWDEEMAGRAANERQAGRGRALAESAAAEIGKILNDYNRGPELARDPATGQILYNQRTGMPVYGPRPTLAGLQGLAVLYKIATESERVALGIPTMISKSDTKLTAQVETASAPNGLSLEEWREKSRRERLGITEAPPSAGPGGIVDASPSPSYVRALPAPQEVSPLPHDVAAGLRDADLAALPAEWTEAAE